MKKFLALLLSLLLILSIMPSMTFAEDEEPQDPAHGKTLKDNGDGTYKLELSVTGDADYDAEPVKANIIIVLDTSGSMDFLIPSTTGSRGSTSTTGDTRNNNFALYRNTGGSNYVAISDSDNYTGRVYRYQNRRYSEYTGTRYSTTSRMDATKTSVNNLIDTLASQNTTANPDVMEMSLITFESNGHYNTPNSASANGWVSGTATSLKNTVNNLDADGGTNWDDALYRANALAAAKATAQPNEAVYIVFFSDGEPTFSNSSSNSDSPTSHSHESSSNQGTGGSTTDAREYNSAYYHANQIHNATYNSALYGIFAFGTEETYMKNVISYGNYGDSTHANSVAGELYFNANSPEDIENAFKKIATSIIEAVGITEVSITDGTTSNVATSTEPAELLEVDDESFEYWLTWNVSSNNTFTSFIDGEVVECTVQKNGNNVVITWEGGTASYEGTITGSVVKVKWTGKTDFYDFDPPEANFSESTGKVDWSLASVGTLLNEVTYSVTFDVYPSQETLDAVADIRNNPGEDGAWADLDPAVQKYITKDGNLKTNTSATLTYSDTRLEEPGPKTSEFEDPDPVENSAIQQLAVSKVWDNQLESDWNKPTSISLDVVRDNDPHYTVTLGNNNNWTGSVYISIGILGSDGKPLEGSEGHDFSFSEPHIEGSNYKWEIDAPTVHPMLINNKATMLIKVDEKHPVPNGAETYSFNNATYYVDKTGAALTATNERRSSLNLVKAVDGEDAPEDAVFPFTLNVVDPLAPATAPSATEDPNHDSDYWIWISVWDKDQQAVTDAVVSGATHAGETSSWYYGVSGQNIVLNVKDGYSIRINNVPTGTTYTITEGNSTTSGFVFDSAKIEFTDGREPDPDWAFTGGKTSTGSIDSTNAVYTVTYTNTYQLVDINVDKVWDDNDNQDGFRPETLALTLNGAPTGTTVPTPTITKSEDGNTWTYVWKGLPRFDSTGKEITYTVTEGTVPQNYTCATATVNDGGTITNTHTPVLVEKVATKEWVDGENAKNSRPSSITFNLMKKVGNADATKLLTVTLDGTADAVPEVTDPVGYESAAWEATFKNLPKFENGTEIEYSITEDTVNNYDTTISEDGSTITNTYAFGDLEITKTVDPGNGDTSKTSDKEFTFTVNLYTDSSKETAVTGSFNYTIADTSGTISNGGTLKLKGGQTATITDIPNGTYYVVTEAAADGYATTKTGDTGTIESNKTKTAAFTNTYSAKPVTAQIPVVKNVTPANSGAADITGKFTFTLTAGSNTASGNIDTPMPSSNTVLCGADGVTVEFGAITFNAPGTYTYTVTESETNGAVGGITLDSDKPRTITVVVTDDGAGNLSAAVNGGETVSFNNPYSVNEISITIPVEKVLSVPSDLIGPDITEEYTFTIADDTSDDVTSPLPETKSIKNPGAKGGSMTFGPITYTEAGTYKYTITEAGEVAGVSNDTAATKTVTVTVTNEGDGTLSYKINKTDDETDDVTKFTNTYSAKPVTATFPVQKVMIIPDDSEDAPTEWSYTINVTAGEGAPTVTTMSGSVTNETDTVTFGPFEFTTPGKFTYTVKEVGTIEGVVNDPNAATGKTVTIEIEDGKEGELVVKSISSTSDSPLKFTNSYHETAFTIPVTKTLSKDPANLTGPDITDKYTFTITGDDEAPLPETVSVKNSGGSMEFGPITFNEPGTYTYHATESGEVKGVTNDPNDKTVKVTVTRNEETGELTAAFAEGSETSFDFVNTYTVEPVTAKFSVKKVMNVVGLGPESWSYAINVAAEGGAPKAETMTGTVTNTNDTVTFGDFTFTKPGDYVYTVTESGTVAGVTNDAAAEEGKTVTITVTDNKDGTLSAEADNSTITFTNSYSYKSTTVVLQVNKTLDTPDGVTAPDITGKYTFTLAAKDGAPMPESGEETVTNPAVDGGTVAFGQITFTEPGDYTYTVTESGSVKGIVNDSELTKTVTVKVVDGRNGELVATVDYGNGKANVEFVNTYEVVDVPVNKTWDDADDQDGYRPKEITINLLADGTKVDTVSVSADKDGKWAHTFTNVPKYGENAKVITYTVTEEKVDKYETSITGDASKGFTVTNKHTPEVTDVTITKNWNDNNNQDGIRPSADAFKAKLHLMADGTEVKDASATVKDNGDGTYTVTYTGLDKKAAGKEIVYTVKEDAIDKYETEQSEVKNGGTITNTHSPEKFKIKVTKIWVDESNKYGLRPASVKFTVSGDDGKTYDVTLKGTGDTWTAELEVLKYRDGGKEVKYTVDEEKITAGYAKKIEDLTITNTFKPCWGDPPVMKEVKGDKVPKAETFTFKLTAVSTTAKGLEGKMPMPEAANGAQEMTMDVKAGDAKEFGKFDLVIPGVYTYTITEVPGSVEGYTYSTEKHTVVYTVTTNDDNSLKCVKTVDGVEIVGDETDKANVSKFKIINEYTKPEETPPTGDTTNLLLWGGMSLTSLLGLGYMFFRRKREDQ